MTVAVGNVVKYSKTYLDAAAARNWGSRRLGRAKARRGTVIAARELNAGIVVVDNRRVVDRRLGVYVEWDGPGNGWEIEWADSLAVVSGDDQPTSNIALSNSGVPK